MKYVHFKVFKSTIKSWKKLFGEESWKTLFGQAAEFADTLGRERLINISHSADRGSGVVTVWFWADHPRTKES